MAWIIGFLIPTVSPMLWLIVSMFAIVGLVSKIFGG